MSLIIEIGNVAARAVEAAWARARGNRERTRLRLDVQAVREEAMRDNPINKINGVQLRGTGWEGLYTEPPASLCRRDEPVAHPFNKAAAGAPPIGFLHIDSSNAPTGTVYVFSGDRSRYRLGTNQGGFAPQASAILLPISSGRAIFAAAFYESPVSPSTDYVYLHSNIFVVGLTTVRQLTRELPASLRSFLDFAIDYSRQASENGYTPVDQLSSYATYSFGGTSADGGSPTCYQMIRDGFPFVGQTYDVADVRAWSELDLSEVPSYDSAEMIDLYFNTGAIQRRLRRYPGLITPAMLENYELAPLVDPLYGFKAMAIVDNPIPGGPSIIPAFSRYCSDFGVPDYCREQLLGMGFTSEDLEP